MGIVFLIMSKLVLVCFAAVVLSALISESNGQDVFMPPYRCLDRAYDPVGPRGRFTPRRRDIRDLMSEIHDEQTLKDKPDCGVIDPASPTTEYVSTTPEPTTEMKTTTPEPTTTPEQ